MQSGRASLQVPLPHDRSNILPHFRSYACGTRGSVAGADVVE